MILSLFCSNAFLNNPEKKTVLLNPLIAENAFRFKVIADFKQIIII